MKTICIYHSRDLDGWMSAAIVKKSFLRTNVGTIEEKKDLIINDFYINEGNRVTNKQNILTFLGWDYGDVIPDLSEYDKAIMCDVSFKYEEMVHLGTELIWIDHHKSAIEEVEKGLIKDVGYIAGLRDTKFAACELTWKYFFPDETMPEIVRLLGRYDCFGHKGTDEEQRVLEFQYGARQIISNYEEAYNMLHLMTYLHSPISGPLGTIIPSIDAMKHIQNAGKSIYNYLKTEAKQIYKKAFEIRLTIPNRHNSLNDSMACNTSYDVKFLCVNQERFNPINFGIDYHKEGYDGFACFWYKGGKWNFNLYNDNGEVDCSIIAKRYGGGGHKGAAGFVIDDINNFLHNNS